MSFVAVGMKVTAVWSFPPSLMSKNRFTELTITLGYTTDVAILYKRKPYK